MGSYVKRVITAALIAYLGIAVMFLYPSVLTVIAGLGLMVLSIVYAWKTKPV